MFVIVMMTLPDFCIDVELGRGPARLQVEVVPPGEWALPHCPQFLVSLFQETGLQFMTLIIEDGRWVDLGRQLTEEQYGQKVLDNWPEAPYLPTPKELAAIGQAISDTMVVTLTAYIGLFIPHYPTPTLN